MLYQLLTLLETETEREKFEELYREYRGLMRVVAFEVLRDSSLAEDAVHDAFMKVLSLSDRIGAVKSKSTKAFLIVTVKNTALNLLRKEKTIKEVELQAPGEKFSRDISWDQVSTESVLKAIEGLPENQRDAVYLKVRTGLNDREVADLLGITEANLRKRLQRARQGIIREMKREEEKQCN